MERLMSWRHCSGWN